MPLYYPTLSSVDERRPSPAERIGRRCQLSTGHLSLADHNSLLSVRHRGPMRARDALVLEPSSPAERAGGRDEGKRARVRVLRSTYSNSDHVRMLAALDGVARRPALGSFEVIRQKRVRELSPRHTQGHRSMAAARSMARPDRARHTAAVLWSTVIGRKQSLT